MITLVRNPEREWDVASLVRELRASTYIVEKLLPHFLRIGLVVYTDSGRWVWQPASPEIEAMARGIQKTYEVTPFTLIQVIAEAPDHNLRIFADAFRIRWKNDDTQ